MLLTVQYPIADARGLIDGGPGRLDRPTWPQALKDKQYVRFLGQVHQRPRGGLQGWGEDLFCAADRGIRFADAGRFADSAALRTRGAFRRFYFDGYAVARFELGVAITGRPARRADPWLNLSSGQTKAVVEGFLTTRLSVSDGAGGRTATGVAQAGSALRKLYYRATTKKSLLAGQPEPSWWVAAARPMLFLVRGASEAMEFPYPFLTGKPIDARYGIAIELRSVRLGKEWFGMWVMTLQPTFDRTVARHLRLSLLRLHAECECLGFVFSWLTPAKLSLDGDVSRLEDYLDEAYSRVAKSESTTRKLTGGDQQLAELALAVNDAIDPGERDSILIQLAKTTKSVRQRTETILRKKSEASVIIVNNNFQGANIGGVNTGDGTFNQGTNLFQPTYLQGVDFSELSSELAKLREHVASKPDGPEKQQAIEAVTQAQQGAVEQDRSKVWKALASTGKWLLDAAKDIAVPLATAAIGAAIGIL